MRGVADSGQTPVVGFFGSANSEGMVLFTFARENIVEESLIHQVNAISVPERSTFVESGWSVKRAFDVCRFGRTRAKPPDGLWKYLLKKTKHPGGGSHDGSN